MLTKNMKQKTFFSIVTRWNGYGLKGDVSFGCPQQATLYSRTLFFELQSQRLVRILPCICANFWLNQNMAKKWSIFR